MPAQRTAMPDTFTPVVPFDACFDAVYGLEVVSADLEGAGVIEGRVAVGPGLLAGHGSVHGGVLAAAAEALASRGTALSALPEGNLVMGLANDTSLLEPVRDGVLHLAARVVHRGDDAWLWTIEARDDAGRPCAFSRVTVAVRPAPGAAPGPG